MNPPPSTPTLACKDCGYANEPERVYCHNCGSKLDRSQLPKEDPRHRENTDRTRRRIRRMTNPGASLVRPLVRGLVKTLLFAAIVAAVILMVRPPADLPAKEGLSIRMISSDLLDLLHSPQPRSTAFSQSDLNHFLGAAHAKTGGLIPGVTYKRTFVNLEPGVARITLERSFWGYPIYTGTLYRAEANSGVFAVANVGGNIGLLPISPVLMPYVEKVLLKDIHETFQTEIDELKQMAFLRVEKERVSLASSGQPR